MIKAGSRRFTTSLAIACALHAVLLFGIGMANTSANDPPRTLHVTLSTSASEKPDLAKALAADNQSGPDDDTRPPPSPARADQQKQARAASDQQPELSAESPLGRPSDAPGATSVLEEKKAASQQHATAAASLSPEKVRSAFADSRAAYLESWRRSVERMGNRSLSAQTLRQAAGKSLTLEVTVAADGRLLESRVRNSSGDAELDASAQTMLRDAAPFSEFPPALRQRHEQMTFAYVWRILADTATSN